MYIARVCLPAFREGVGEEGGSGSGGQPIEKENATLLMWARRQISRICQILAILGLLLCTFSRRVGLRKRSNDRH